MFSVQQWSLQMFHIFTTSYLMGYVNYSVEYQPYKQCINSIMCRAKRKVNDAKTLYLTWDA